jgi:hypothetical protein
MRTVKYDNPPEAHYTYALPVATDVIRDALTGQEFVAVRCEIPGVRRPVAVVLASREAVGHLIEALEESRDKAKWSE